MSLNDSKDKVINLIRFVIFFQLAIVGATIFVCFMTDKCNDEDTQAIKDTMNGLATKAFALYAAEKAGQVANEKKKEVCPKCGE